MYRPVQTPLLRNAFTPTAPARPGSGDLDDEKTKIGLLQSFIKIHKPRTKHKSFQTKLPKNSFVPEACINARDKKGEMPLLKAIEMDNLNIAKRPKRPNTRKPMTHKRTEKDKQQR
jgi:hypothetical protein